jgi:hypothetical protein
MRWKKGRTDPLMAPKASFLSYVKSAFFWHWNLLAVCGGVVFSFLSRRPDMFLPLVGAGELLYLGMLSSNPRFRKAMDARRTARALAPDQSHRLAEIRNSINSAAWGRFVALQNRCRTLQNLSRQIQGQIPLRTSLFRRSTPSRSIVFSGCSSNCSIVSTRLTDTWPKPTATTWNFPASRPKNGSNGPKRKSATKN